MSTEELSKAYDPAEVESKWYKIWEERGYFHADVNSSKKPYTIVIPPPNVTGQLTMGHILNNTLQDILIRFEKLNGRETCWLPGTDHAGIATQTKVEKELKKNEGLTRYDLGREKFLERVWAWKEQYGGKIIRQLRSLGTSCDWQRERFTMDEGLSAAVQECFIRLYNKGLIYKGHRIIVINGIPENTIFLGKFTRDMNSNLWMGVDYATDEESIKVEPLQANSELYFFQMRMKMDVNFVRPSEVVVWTTYHKNVLALSASTASVAQGASTTVTVSAANGQCTVASSDAKLTASIDGTTITIAAAADCTTGSKTVTVTDVYGDTAEITVTVTA